MGKSKRKDPEITPDDEEKGNDDIFKTLFGHQNAVASLFSDLNPFKRKPEDQTLDQAPASPGNGGSEPEKRKRPKEAADLSGKGDEIDVSEKKKKKKKRKREEVENEYDVKKYGSVDDDAEKGAKAKVGEKRKTVDNPAEVLVPKEGFDDEDKLLRTVFVGNLPLKVKKKGLIKEFSKFGDVESVRVRSVPITDTKTPRKGAVITKQFHEAADCVHAYVVFKTEEFAQAALSNNMAVVEGHHIRVDRACPPRKKMKGDENSLYDHKRTVFVGNLPFDVKDEEVYQLFCGIKDMESNVEGVRIIRDPHNNLGKGFAYVLFKTREAAHSVVKKRNVKLRDRELRLFHAKAESTPSKRKNPSTPSDNSGSLPPKKFRGSSSTDGSKNNKGFTASASMSYQGLQSSKSGVQKKVAKARSRPEMPLSKPTAPKGKEGGRKGKRPTVAARKAKSKALREIGVSDRTGMKRKMESRTPDSAHRKKKAKKF